MSSLAKCIAELARNGQTARLNFRSCLCQNCLAESDWPRGDYFMHGQDCRMRQVGLPGNVCCAVIKLGPGFDVERLRRRIAESPIMDWLARARLSRPLPILSPALWRAGGKPQNTLFEHDTQVGIAGLSEMTNISTSLPPAVAQRKLHARRGPGLAFDVMHHR